MPISHRVHAAFGLSLFFLLGSPVFADELSVTSALRTMLATMPDVEDAPPGGYQIDFGDVRVARALLEATGTAPFDPEERALAALLRGGTPIFVRSASADEASFRAANGFGFGDVESNMQYARPPIWLNMLSLGFGSGAEVADGLLGVGFTQEERHGLAVFWRGEQDNAVMQPDLPRDDLYGGAVRRSVRLALVEGVLAFSSAWGVLDTVLTNELPRMTEDTEIAALLDALDAAAASDERLILANLFIAVLPAEYPGNLLAADLFGDDGHVTLAAFLPTDIIPAEDQAAMLQANWSGLPISSEGASFSDIIGAEAVVQVIGGDQPVIVMRLETPLDSASNRLLLNRGFGALQSALLRGDLQRLLSEQP